MAGFFCAQSGPGEESMVYLFHGEDALACEEALEKLRQAEIPAEAADLAVTRLEGATLSIASLIEHCAAAPLLSPRRLIIIEGIAGRLEKNAEPHLAQQLREYLPHLARTTTLVFRERSRLGPKHPLVALVAACGQVQEFAPRRGRDLSRWIAEQVRRAGAEITPAACDLLAATGGSEAMALHHEIEKLVIYVGPQGQIDEHLVSELASEAHLSDIFALVDAIGQRRRARAMLELRRLLQAGQHPLYLLAMVVRQFRLLLQVKAIPAGDRQPDQVARILGVHPFVAEKTIAQAQPFRRQELERTYHRLVQADQEIKTGQHEDEVALELAIVDVTGG